MSTHRTTGHVFIATSLDGYIAGPGDDLHWLDAYAGAGEDTGYEAFMASVDGLIMGRRTFETVLGFGDWPYQKPVVVLSRSLSAADLPASLGDKIILSARAPAEVLDDVGALGWRRAYVDGGAVISAFLKAGLIQEMVITRVPMILGGGIPLFSGGEGPRPLRHLDTRAFPSGLVQSRYTLPGTTG